MDFTYGKSWFFPQPDGVKTTITYLDQSSAMTTIYHSIYHKSMTIIKTEG